MCGAGRVGRGASGDEAGYQISQRADYIEVEVGLETTLKRGIINTRDEPHADADKYRRLHVIIGDANMSEYSTLLKVGTAALVLDMIEAGVRFDELRLSEPVRSVHRISHDPSLKLLVDTVDGRKLTALDVQRSYFEKACKHVENTLGADVDEATAEVLAIWGEVLDDLAREPLSTADRLDWTAKLRLLEGYRERDGLAWDAPRLHLVDLQYTDVRMAKGLYNRLAARGSIKRLVTEEQVTAAMTTPPEDTRAYFRGRCLERYPAEVAAASWDSVIFDLGRESLVRIPTLEPLRGTRRHVGELIDNSRTAEELVEAAHPRLSDFCRPPELGLSCTTTTGGVMSQEQTKRQGGGGGDDDEAGDAAAAGQERREKLGEDVDTILDEIDDVLEENAEDFVRAYVQKGGE